MEESNPCPAKREVFGGWLTCDREDDWMSHQMLLHRNESAQREWVIEPLDRVRWGVVGPVKKKKPGVTGEFREEPLEGAEDV